MVLAFCMLVPSRSYPKKFDTLQCMPRKNILLIYATLLWDKVSVELVDALQLGIAIFYARDHVLNFSCIALFICFKITRD